MCASPVEGASLCVRVCLCFSMCACVHVSASRRCRCKGGCQMSNDGVQVNTTTAGGRFKGLMLPCVLPRKTAHASCLCPPCPLQAASSAWCCFSKACICILSGCTSKEQLALAPKFVTNAIHESLTVACTMSGANFHSPGRGSFILGVGYDHLLHCSHYIIFS